ncbi:hypothetical protein LCGC14_1473100, partial [marine sediment metagenome]
FSPEVVYNYSDLTLITLTDQIRNETGLTPEQLNSSFHKSWQKIKEASIEQLVFEQIVHYITTYGFEFFGIYDESTVYIPKEKLEIPEVDIDGFKFVVIKGYKKAEIKEKVLDLLKSGIALHEDTIKDVVEIAKYAEVDQENIDDIKNKEVKIALCDHLKLFPENPTEFLRYVIYKSIGKTLLIKDMATIALLKETAFDREISGLFKKYKKKYGLEKLSSIFYRFKPIFLAFKTDRNMKPIINKLRKLAIKHHKPMKSDYLNDVTAMIKRNETINKKVLWEHLDNANPFRKIRLAYALNYRTGNAESIIYKIRNGKGWAETFDFGNSAKAKQTLGIVLDSLVGDIRNNVEGKKIFIPDYIKYALPATEKQFTGNFPSGTCVTVDKDMVFGVHWNNVDHSRIDLDLSLMSPETGKIGWDSSYRTDDRSILFSGDMTDAHGENGATELFYVKRKLKEEFIMFLNYYNYNESVEVPYSIIVAKEKAGNFKKNYMVNPNNVKAIAKTKMTERQKILGLLVTTTKECRFYFSEVSVGRSITASDSEHAENSRKYLVNFYRNAISLNDLLIKAGAIIVQDEDEHDIDLSPENLEKDSIIKLLV